MDHLHIFLGVIQTKVREEASGDMYGETEGGGKKLQAIVDTGANTIYGKGSC